MATSVQLDREEYIEQAYFFRTLRERTAENLPAQEVLGRLHEELLTTTRLPMAVQFLASELKHSGVLHGGMARLSHYFSAFQTYVVRQAEEEGLRFTMPTALLLLEREAGYRANQPTVAGLFVYQFEGICRNRLGYDDGLRAIREDTYYDSHWKHYLEQVRKQVGVIDFADLVYLRSELYVMDQRRNQPQYVPPVPPLFGEKEGKIAKASRGRDPLFLFSALQRQLSYPEVPRVKPRDDLNTRLEIIQNKLRELEQRIKLAEGELRGGIDLSQFSADALKNIKDD